MQKTTHPSIPSFLSIQLILTLLFAHLTTANVEKTIFIAPHPSPIPAENPGLDDLGLERLSPSGFVVRTYLNASFPTEDAPRGSESWFYLEDLNPGQRYEVRICWLATQPTAFTLTTYTLPETISDPALLSALGAFSSARLSSTTSPPSHSDLSGGHNQQDPVVPVPHQPKARHHRHHRRSRSTVEKTQDPLGLTSQAESVLFLRVFAAADYFTLNTSLTETVPPVMVDVILDPFLLNVFPRSLVPTAVWIVVVAALAWFIGGWVVKTFSEIISSAAAADDEDKAKKNKRREETKKKR
ncbi:hypothetical protein VTN77DRAFT_1558 [Rasamsonia byssochlamydoides]|uniref:uncharacterized protein n=1 Tax=Rasamsonia byssochlamydoides TaxID=89139 RepID=UPI003743B189